MVKKIFFFGDLVLNIDEYIFGSKTNKEFIGFKIKIIFLVRIHFFSID